MEKIGGGAQYNSKTFYSYQIYLKGHLHVHVNKDTLKEIVSHVDPESSIYEVEEQMFYNKVCRILIGYYIRELAKLKILNSTRVKSTSKLDHLNAHRTLLDCLIGNNS